MRSVVIYHRLLHGMQVTVLAKAFDSDEFLAIECRQELDAGVNRPDREIIAVEFGQDYRARAAIAFRATLLRPCAMQILTQELQDGSRRIDVVELDQLAVKHKANLVGRCVDVSAPLAHDIQLPRYVE